MSFGQIFVAPNHPTAASSIDFFCRRQIPLDKGHFVHDDLRMVITDDERNHLLMSDDDEKRSFGSR